MMQVLLNLGLGLHLCVRLYLLVCKLTFEHLTWPPDPLSSASKQLFFLKLSSPIQSTPSLRWHRFLLRIEISAPVTTDTIFYNDFQEVSSPRMNPSPKREKKQLDFFRISNSYKPDFSKASHKMDLDVIKETRAQSLSISGSQSNSDK